MKSLSSTTAAVAVALVATAASAGKVERFDDTFDFERPNDLCPEVTVAEHVVVTGTAHYDEAGNIRSIEHVNGKLEASLGDRTVRDYFSTRAELTFDAATEEWSVVSQTGAGYHVSYPGLGHLVQVTGHRGLSGREYVDPELDDAFRACFGEPFNVDDFTSELFMYCWALGVEPAPGDAGCPQ